MVVLLKKNVSILLSISITKLTEGSYYVLLLIKLFRGFNGGRIPTSFRRIC